MSIALKYWVFQQTGWGNITAPTVLPPPPPLPESPPLPHSDGDGFVPIFGRFPTKILRPPISQLGRLFPQNFAFFDDLQQRGEATSIAPLPLFFFDFLNNGLTTLQILDVATQLYWHHQEIVGLPVLPMTMEAAHVYESGYPGFRAVALLEARDDVSDRSEAISIAGNTLALWNGTDQAVVVYERLRETFRSFLYERQESEEIESELEELLPAIVAQILQTMDEEE